MDVNAAEQRSDSVTSQAARSKPTRSGEAFQGVMHLMASLANSQAERQERAERSDDDGQSEAPPVDRPDRRADNTRTDEDPDPIERQSAPLPPVADRANKQPPRDTVDNTPAKEVAEPRARDPKSTTAEKTDTTDTTKSKQTSEQPTDQAPKTVAKDDQQPADVNIVAAQQVPLPLQQVPLPLKKTANPKQPAEPQKAVEGAEQDPQAAETTAKPGEVPPAVSQQQAATPAPQQPAASQVPASASQAPAPAAPAIGKPPSIDTATPKAAELETARPTAVEAKPASSTRPEAPTLPKPAADPQPSGVRPDALAGAKVTVEQTPIMRSQGVSSAVLLQAQQASAGQPSTPQPSLHVGSNQPTFVGADGSGNANGNGAGGSSSGHHGNQLAGQGAGAAVGATIGQRGFGGEAARAQFQEILAARTSRAPASSTGPASTGSAPLSSSLSATTMAGPGGPQSTLTASLANRAETTAHGRPGANAGTVADQVAVKLSSMAKNGSGRVTIKLHPEDLGKLDVKLEIGKDGLVRASVTVEKPETLDLLQRDQRALERALQDAGLKTNSNSLEFDLRGEDGRWAGESDADENGGSTKTASNDDDTETLADADPADEGGVKADGSVDLVA